MNSKKYPEVKMNWTYCDCANVQDCLNGGYKTESFDTSPLVEHLLENHRIAGDIESHKCDCTKKDNKCFRADDGKACSCGICRNYI